MKKLLFTFLAIAIIFSGCEKEEEPVNSGNINPITYAFSCKLDGEDFTDSNPVASIEPSTNVLTIDAEDGDNTIRIIIYNFSIRDEGDEISLNNLTDKAYVTMSSVFMTNTQSGNITFSEIGSELSGVFNFKCNNLQTFESVTVTEGVFEGISYL